MSTKNTLANNIDIYENTNYVDYYRIVVIPDCFSSMLILSSANPLSLSYVLTAMLVDGNSAHTTRMNGWKWSSEHDIAL